MIYLFLITMLLAASLYALIATGLTIASRSYSKSLDVRFVSALLSRKITIATSACMASLMVIAGVLLTLNELRNCSKDVDDDACSMGLVFPLIPLGVVAFFFLLVVVGLWIGGRVRQQTQATSIFF